MQCGRSTKRPRIFWLSIVVGFCGASGNEDSIFYSHRHRATRILRSWSERALGWRKRKKVIWKVLSGTRARCAQSVISVQSKPVHSGSGMSGQLGRREAKKVRLQRLMCAWCGRKYSRIARAVKCNQCLFCVCVACGIARRQGVGRILYIHIWWYLGFKHPNYRVVCAHAA